MDYEEDFRSTVREVVAAMKSRGKATTTRSANGQNFEGWVIGNESKSSERGNPGGWYEEYWENYDTLLCTDGRFRRVGFWATDGTGGAEKQRSESASELGMQAFVGSKGKPFAEWKAKLERLPYQ